MGLFLNEEMFALEITVEVAEVRVAHGAIENFW